MASTCYLLINSYSSTFNPHAPSELSPSTGMRRLTSDGRRDSPLKRDGGASTAWSSSPRPLPSPAAPELAPRPRDRRPSRQRCCSPLPPARAEPCPPPPRLVPSGLDTCSPHPCQEFREPPCPFPLPPPDADNDADDRRSVDTTMDPPPEDNRPWATQSMSVLSPLPTTEGGGTEHCTLSLPRSRRRSVRYLHTVIPRCGHPRRGIVGAEAEVVVVAGRGGSGRRGSGVVIMTFFCCASGVACSSNLSRLVWEWIFLT